ncbi:cupin domain-containing protein [Streptomyces sp. HUCO-GS316]|uniref:cupin domain-containing protein n=1 Tax=Streptomyces sp. HUCO-GS316 TaxID=2692198 RepID=UPI00136AB1C0|nr:cupin domain-containing protein [Streptomyces sp. HUCO-GS316]MXM65367.1 cupin domain-containing protein [Streptomyces sp. HUCO-GS316]
MAAREARVGPRAGAAELPVTKVAAADVPSSPRHGGDLRIVLGPATTGVASGFMGTGTLAAGERIREHYHPYSDEFVYVVQGALEVTTDGADVHRVTAGEALLIPRMTRHKMLNNGRVPAFVVFHSCPLAPRPELGHVDTEDPDGA